MEAGASCKTYAASCGGRSPWLRHASGAADSATGDAEAGTPKSQQLVGEQSCHASPWGDSGTWSRLSTADAMSQKITEEGVRRISTPSTICSDACSTDEAGQSAADSADEAPQLAASGTCIILDWDDTLLCTSYLALHEDEDMRPEVVRILQSIEVVVVELLERCSRTAPTFIVTSSVSGWIEYSAARFMPGVLPALRKVCVISARARYEDEFPGQVSKWKEQAFLDISRELDAQVASSVLSIGDSPMELDAAHVLGGALDAAAGRCGGGGCDAGGVKVKTVKFRERSSPQELCKQLELVLQKFDKIVESPKALTITLERKWAGGQQR